MRAVVGTLVILALGLGGCATLVRGTEDKVYVLSDPPGANVTTSLAKTCVTPCTLNVGRGDVFTVTLALAGYRSQTVAVETQLSSAGVGAFMENVTTAGLGMIVDAATGATVDHVPNPVKVTLVPIAGEPRPKGKPAPTG